MIQKISARGALFALALVCLSAFGLMLWASRTDSAIDDELAHIPAGYGYVHNLDYRLNPEHPPLVKALAMFPVLFLNPNFPTDSATWQTEVNSQWDMGTKFLYQSGNDADAIIRTARIMPILLTVLLIVLIYFFARELVGPMWALLPAFLFAFDPNVLAHGHYVTTDVGAAFGIVLATFFFIRFLKTPSRKNLIYAGLTFGIAQITKFSAPLLVPLFIFIVLALWLRDLFVERSRVERTLRLRIFLKRLWRSAWPLILIFIIGYVVIVYPVYFLFTANYPITKQVSDTQSILNSFAGGPTPAGALCHGTRCLADLNVWMAKSPILRPFAEYMLGILMVLQRSDGGNTIYYLGAVRGSGGPGYFPTLFLLKEPIPTLIIVLLGLVLALWWMFRRATAARWRIFPAIAQYLEAHTAEFAMTSFVALYWGYSMRSPLNIGIRHLMPTIPFIYILATVAWKKWVARVPSIDLSTSLEALGNAMKSFARSLFFSSLKYLLLAGLLVWLFLETLLVAPYFLSYFNEFAGGTPNGYHYVTDSNYDWGQDLLRLQDWVDDQNERCVRAGTSSACGVEKIAIDYFGGGNPKYYFGDKEVDWSSAKGNPAAQGIHWLVISINQLQGAIQPLAPGQNRKPEDSYSWLTALRPPQPGMGGVPKPDFRAGTSLFIYHL